MWAYGGFERGWGDLFGGSIVVGWSMATMLDVNVKFPNYFWVHCCSSHRYSDCVFGVLLSVCLCSL